jgi:hypothetical protein
LRGGILIYMKSLYHYLHTYIVPIVFGIAILGGITFVSAQQAWPPNQNFSNTGPDYLKTDGQPQSKIGNLAIGAPSASYTPGATLDVVGNTVTDTLAVFGNALISNKIAVGTSLNASINASHQTDGLLATSLEHTDTERSVCATEDGILVLCATVAGPVVGCMDPDDIFFVPEATVNDPDMCAGGGGIITPTFGPGAGPQGCSASGTGHGSVGCASFALNAQGNRINQYEGEFFNPIPIADARLRGQNPSGATVWSTYGTADYTPFPGATRLDLTASAWSGIGTSPACATGGSGLGIPTGCAYRVRGVEPNRSTTEWSTIVAYNPYFDVSGASQVSGTKTGNTYNLSWTRAINDAPTAPFFFAYEITACQICGVGSGNDRVVVTTVSNLSTALTTNQIQSAYTRGPLDFNQPLEFEVRAVPASGIGFLGSTAPRSQEITTRI